MNFKTDQRRYKVFWEGDVSVGTPDSWRFMEIRGIRGWIYPWNEKKLVCVIGLGPVGMRIKRANKWPLIREHDEGREFLIDNKDLSQFADYIGAYKKRILSPEDRERAMRNIGRHKFVKRPRA